MLPDWSEAGIDAEIARLHRALDDARAYDTSGLTDEQKFEHNYLIAQTRHKLFWLETADWPHKNPAYYVGGGLDPTVYKDGRASCRERVWQYVSIQEIADALKKK